ncbi:MAG: Antitoxin [Chloroflexi bacterium]|nr:Antitoxin [Chloroflexota bacterium]
MLFRVPSRDTMRTSELGSVSVREAPRRVLSRRLKGIPMAAHKLTTQTVTTTDAGRDFPKLVRKVSRQETRVVVEENGKPVAAIISARDLEHLTEMEAALTERFKVVEQIQSKNADLGPDEVQRIVDEEIAAMRAERRDRIASSG